MRFLTVFLLILLLGCDPLPEEGEIIENKLTGERYEVDMKGKYRTILSVSRSFQSIRREVLEKFSSSRSTPIIFIHPDKNDSLKNPTAIRYKGKVERTYFPEYNNSAYSREYYILTAEDFKNKYKVVE